MEDRFSPFDAGFLAGNGRPRRVGVLAYDNATFVNQLFRGFLFDYMVTPGICVADKHLCFRNDAAHAQEKRRIAGNNFRVRKGSYIADFCLTPLYFAFGNQLCKLHSRDYSADITAFVDCSHKGVIIWKNRLLVCKVAGGMTELNFGIFCRLFLNRLSVSVTHRKNKTAAFFRQIFNGFFARPAAFTHIILSKNLHPVAKSIFKLCLGTKEIYRVGRCPVRIVDKTDFQDFRILISRKNFRKEKHDRHAENHSERSERIFVFHGN